MSETQTTPFNIRGFRATVLAFAYVLGGIAIWILAAEVLRPPTGLVYGQRDAAVRAARIGLVRGDLWSDAAFAYGDILWTQAKNASNTDVTLFEQSRPLTELAISYAPHDSRLWLLLAANYFRFDRLNAKALAALKMSYYTGSNTVAVVPGRLLLAVQSPALSDDDFQELVRHDIRLVALRRSELMPALAAAYNNAPFSGRQFIEKTLGALDPSLLASIRPKG
jgi:hypothetical protein